LNFTLSFEAKMKKIFRFLLSFFLVTAFFYSMPAASQTLPAFKMKLTNGKIYTTSDVSTKEPLVLIYFAPDCEHCQVLIKQLLNKISVFQHAQILLVTFESLDAVAAFKKEYHLDKYPNIKVGMEMPVFFFRTYYDLQHTPFTALFNKNKKLIASYKDYTPLEDLIKKLKSLEKK